MKAARTYKEKQIPQDIIIMEILTRIPCKSIMRFRCVSKLWSSLISDPYFIDAHSDRTKKGSSSNLIYKIKQDEPCQIKISVVNIEKRAREKILLKKDPRIGTFKFCTSISCNGLICLIICYEVDSDNEDDDNHPYYQNEDVYLFNPATRESRTLPKDTLGIGLPGYDKICLFGFYPPTKEYKVVQLLYQKVGWMPVTCSLRCEVFTLGSKSWKPIGDISYPIWECTNSVCVNGSIYCMTDDDLKAPNEHIVSFDLGDEKFSLIPLPKGMGDIHRADLVELQGALCLSVKLFEGRMDLWFLRDHAIHDWIKEYTITYDDFHYRGYKIHIYIPITIHSGKVCLVTNFGFVYHDPQSKRMTAVCGYHKRFCINNKCAYTESLVSPHGELDVHLG